VALNCGALPESLMESELFGHRRGAFTGAVADKIGCFQAAHGGTLFLDEIGEMPATLQVKLLRALQERVITPVGDTKPIAVDLRVVAATHVDLEQAIKVGRFREDLYYRLNVMSLELPPLRRRDEDVVLIARFLLDKCARDLDRPVRGFTRDAVIALRKHLWPGNIRELENRIKKGVLLTDGVELTPEDLDWAMLSSWAVSFPWLRPARPGSAATSTKSSRSTAAIVRRPRATSGSIPARFFGTSLRAATRNKSAPFPLHDSRGL